MYFNDLGPPTTMRCHHHVIYALIFRYFLLSSFGFQRIEQHINRRRRRRPQRKVVRHRFPAALYVLVLHQLNGANNFLSVVCLTLSVSVPPCPWLNYSCLARSSSSTQTKHLFAPVRLKRWCAELKSVAAHQPSSEMFASGKQVCARASTVDKTTAKFAQHDHGTVVQKRVAKRITMHTMRYYSSP